MAAALGGKEPDVTEFVCRRTGLAYEVGDEIDRSGDAVIHAVASPGPDLALKQYLPAALHRRPDLEARIKAMISHAPAYRPDAAGPVLCAWPEDAASVDGRFAGFVMPRVDVRGATTIPEVATRHDTDRRRRVAVAANLARAVAVLHDADVVIGDFRAWNLLTWPDGGVTLLGCDRMQVVDPATGRRFPCVAGRDDCTPPELQLQATLSSTFRAPSSDVFTLALHLHQLLLDGAHPFRGRWTDGGDSPPGHVLAQRGLWTHAGDRRLHPDADAPPLAALPPALQRYFRAAFVDGARDPGARPPAREWLAELVRLQASLGTDPVGPRPEPARPAIPAPTGRSVRTLPAGPDLDPPADPSADPATVRAVPAPRTGSDGTRRLEPTVPRRLRPALLRVAAVITALVVAGGLVGVGIAARRAAPRVADPTVSAQTRTAAPAEPRAEEPEPTGSADAVEALEQVRSRDAPLVEALAESWVAQLSARPARPDGAAAAAVLAGHDTLRRQHPGALLLRSTDWNYDGRSWVTVMGERFATAEDANGWCDAQRLGPQDCFAKKLSHSGVVAGSARYRR